MADEEIRSLTQETALSAASAFVLQDTTDRATRADFSQLGGLAYNTDNDTNADHADITGLVGTLHTVDMSAALLTSEVVYTLPATAKLGERCGVYVTATSTTAGEEISIKTSTGDKINGTDYSVNEHTRVFMAGEVMVYECIDAATCDWRVAHDGRIPQKAQAYQSSFVTNGWAAASWTQQPWNTEGFAVGSIVDLTNDKITVRRAGYYRASCLVSVDDVATNNLVGAGIKDEAGTWFAASRIRIGNGAFDFEKTATALLEVTTANVGTTAASFEGWGYNGSSNTENVTAGLQRNHFAIEEVL